MTALEWVKKKVKDSDTVITTKDLQLYDTYSVNLLRSLSKNTK